MLTGLVVVAMVTGATFLFSVLGAGQVFGTEITGAFTTLAGYLPYVNLFLPVDAVINCMLITSGLVTVGFTIRLILYALSMVRGNEAPASPWRSNF